MKVNIELNSENPSDKDILNKIFQNNIEYGDIERIFPYLPTRIYNAIVHNGEKNIRTINELEKELPEITRLSNIGFVSKRIISEALIKLKNGEKPY